MRSTASLAALAAQLGQPPPSRTRSRRHGHRPKAQTHVERWIMVVALDARPAQLARALGISRSTLYESLAAGREIARLNAG